MVRSNNGMEGRVLAPFHEYIDVILSFHPLYESITRVYEMDKNNHTKRVTRENEEVIDVPSPKRLKISPLPEDITDDTMIACTICGLKTVGSATCYRCLLTRLKQREKIRVEHLRKEVLYKVVAILDEVLREATSNGTGKE